MGELAAAAVVVALIIDWLVGCVEEARRSGLAT